MERDLTRRVAAALVLGLALVATAASAAVERSRSYTYNDLGQVTSVDGPRTDVQDVTHFAYDSAGNRTRVTNALGHEVTIAEHDAAGRPLRVIDANGVATTLAYDARGRLVRRSVAGATTRFTYDATGEITRLEQPDGSFLTFDYDAAHRLVGVTDAAGNHIAYTLDAAGNRTETRITDASGTLAYRQRQVFDHLDQLIERIGAARQTTHYKHDANGNVTEIIDARGHHTYQAYDALDRLVQRTDALGGETGYAYDDEDRLTSVTDARGNTTRYTYDEAGDLVRRESPDSGVTTYTYDDAGNATSRTDAKGQVTEYTYDALDRITGIHYVADPSQDVRLHYDEEMASHGIGRLTRIEDATGSTRFDYTARGRIARMTRTTGGTSYTVEYSYNAADRLTGVTYPSGRTLTYRYDAVGNIEQVTTSHDGATVVLANDVTHAPFGGLTGLTYGNGLTLTRGYDQDYQLTELTIPGVMDRTYTYDPTGNITRIGAANAQSFDYDALDRLTDATGRYGELDYAYDGVHNRTKRIVDGEVETYMIDPTSNRLTRIDDGTAVAIEHDANGNIIRRGNDRYRYNVENRLVEVTRDGERLATYGYDGQGRRTRKTVNGKTTHFVYGPGGQLVGEYEPDGTPIREYAYLDGAPLAVFGDTGIGYIHTDHLGTPRAVTDAEQTVVWRWRSTPFGQDGANADSDGDGYIMPLRFPGQYFDKESGIYYNGFRYYMPLLGEYTRSDPVGLWGGHEYVCLCLGKPAINIRFNGTSGRVHIQPSRRSRTESDK
ncbi:RHS repeat-associated core domain-containing protein [Arhodomonas sp. AD133]|uniref:RHS repeat-associated core domain-containing protein n=1 Tax=Arhodomonas sp. AD133 TaxID=3415009 RepID=UPI003EC0EBAB